MSIFYVSHLLHRFEAPARDYVEKCLPELERSYREEDADSFSDRCSAFFKGFPERLTIWEREVKERLREHLYQKTFDKRAREISQRIEAKRKETK